MLGLSPLLTTEVLLVLSVLVFVPIKDVYPSRTVTLLRTNMVLAVAFLVLWAPCDPIPPAPPPSR